MTRLERLLATVRQKAEALLDELEDPGKLLDHSLREMGEECAAFEGQVARAMADERFAREAVEAARARLAAATERAESAVAAGDDAAAREALEGRARFEAQVQQLSGELEAQEKLVAEMKATLREMREVVEEGRKNRPAVLAQLAQARAKDRIDAAIQERDPEGPFRRFSELGEKVVRMGAELEAHEELKRELEEGRAAPPPPRTFDVDAELEALKAELRDKKK